MLKISEHIKTYKHHDYLEPELRKLVEEGKTDVLDLTFDADEVSLFDTHSLIRPFLQNVYKESKDIVKYYEEDPFFQELAASTILSYHGLKKVKKEQVFVGNGNYSLFKDIISFLAEKKLMIGNGPQFPEFPSLYTALGGAYKPVFNRDWEFPLNEILEEIKKNNKVSVVFMDIPSNATGNYIKPQEVKRIVGAAQKKGIIVIADEAYANYLSPSQTAAQYVNECSNLIVIRSLSKAFDLGGIRFGYTIMSPELAKHFKEIHSAFEPSVFSVLCGKYVLEKKDVLERHLAKSKDAITHFRKKTTDLFMKMGIKPLPCHPQMPQAMFYKKGENLFKFFVDRKVVVRSGNMYQFTCPTMDDQYIRLRFPLKEASFGKMAKRLS